MEIFIVLLIVWVIVTVVGHGSWVLIRGFFRLITGANEPRFEPPSPSDEKADIAASRRVIRRMVHRDLMDSSSAAELHDQLRNLEYQQTPSTIEPALHRIKPIQDAKAPTTTDVDDAAPVLATDSDFKQDEPGDQPILATLVAAPEAPTPPQQVPPQPTPSVLSKSEVIQSFLAAHNIRWGELVAGMLIVICSIGLVISLWSPLVETHRVIPSLIFLGANAAIYAAGLYTLSRWRLRHTSRAVLAIATLLVPLSVLAGLAAAGTGLDAVQLNDPITLAAIALAGAVYIILLYRGGKALSRGVYAASIAIAVAGPVAILPLVPASVRAFGSDAGWMIVVGSIAVLIASVRLIRLRKRTGVSLGVAGGRARLLVMGFGGFSLAVSIGYTAFAVRGFGLQAMLPIAITTIPALVALAVTARSLMTSARSGTQSLTGAVLCVILIGLAWAILPSTMIAPSWVWYWALVFSVSAAVVGWLAGQPRWLALATLPVGMAATFTSPVWLGQQNWSSLTLWQRMVGGEPMLAASLVAIGAAVAGQVIREPDRRRWIRYAAIVWAGVAMTIAASLSVAPMSALGIAPWWSVTCVLIAGVAVSILLATRNHPWSLATIGATVFAWFSVFRPIQWDTFSGAGSPTVWMTTIVAIAITMLVLRELIPRFAMFTSSNRPTTMRSAMNWQITSNVASILAGVIACLWVNDDWFFSAATLACASVLLFWSSTASRSVEVLRLSQLVTVSLAVVVGYGRFGEWLFSMDAWTTATAAWAWAVLAAAVSGLWILIRQSARVNAAPLNSKPLRRRLQHLTSQQAALEWMPDGWVATIATIFTSLATAWAFAALISQAAHSDIVTYEFRFTLPVAALSVCGAVVWWMQRQQSDQSISRQLASTLIITGIVWGSCQLVQLISADATTQLVVATTLAVGAGIAVPNWVLPRRDPTLRAAVNGLSVVVAPALIAVSSTVLLWVGWFDPIVDKTYAHAFETIAVATWWMIAAAGLLWISKREQDSAAGIVSAVLAPAAAILVTPVFSLSHPVVWIQVAGIVSVMWVAISRRWFNAQQAAAARAAMDGSTLFALVVGIVSSMLVTFSIVFDLSSLHSVFGPAGFVISVLSAVLWCFGWVRLTNQNETSDDRLPWPLGISMLAGQFTWLAFAAGLVSGVQLVEMISVIWCAAAIASLVRYWRVARNVDFVHVGILCVAVTVVTGIVGLRSQLLPWLALATLLVGGLMVASVGRSLEKSRLSLGLSRLLGWFVVGAGGFLLVDRITAGPNSHLQWTMLVIWSAVWIVGWRLLSPQLKTEGPQHSESDEHRAAVLAIPDTEFSIVLLIAVVVETVLFTLSGRHTFQTSVLADPLLWGRVISYVAVGVSTIARANRKLVWPTAIGTLVAATSLVTTEVSIHFDATSNQRFMWAMLPAGFAIAFIAHWLPTIARLLARIVDGSPAGHLGRLIQSTWQVAIAIASLAGMSAVVMIAGGEPGAEIQLTIVAVALSAWAIAEMAESCDGPRLRHAAVTVALISIGLWASVDSGETIHPFLSASMRWLVASVFTIPMVLFVFPKLLGQSVSARWSDAFRRGAEIAAVAAGCSLISMLVTEAVLRGAGGIQDISWPMVIGVAVTLAILSALSGLIAIFSGPGFSLRERLTLSDSQRMQLIIAAQVIGGITWLHIFLCKNWSIFGLRNYWPYTVMALAFISVGVTQWARQRKDAVMSNTLSQTALYLPLIPIVGFWLSGSVDEFSWAFKGDKVRYDLLLAIGSVYYIGVSAMWKGTIPRISAIVLGNAAWWILLVQQPGWSFLAHPQAWLIPPAVCVLVATHLYRDRLDATMASAIRYASTLVIYISSTADIVLQQIGEKSIWGPIVLVLLALAGMASGVVLRVRPFLYLGAMFVFLGVTSMVWHAHQAFDAVWPWWVFGITTGICLLAGLMAIEKNKPRLREYANSLSTWSG